MLYYTDIGHLPAFLTTSDSLLPSAVGRKLEGSERRLLLAEAALRSAVPPRAGSTAAGPRGSVSSRDGFRTSVLDYQTRCDDRLDHLDATARAPTTTDSTTSPPSFGAGSRPPSGGVAGTSSLADFCVIHAELRASEARFEGRVTGMALALAGSKGCAAVTVCA